MQSNVEKVSTSNKEKRKEKKNLHETQDMSTLLMRLSLLLGGEQVCWHLRCYGSSSGSGSHVGCIVLSSVDGASSSAFMSKKKSVK